MKLLTQLLTSVALLGLSVTCLASEMETRAKALVAAEDKKVATAKAKLDRAQAEFDRMLKAQVTPMQDTAAKKRMLDLERKELRLAKLRLSEAKTKKDISNATNHVNYRKQTVATAFKEWERAADAANQEKFRTADVLKKLDQAKAVHEQAVAHSLKIRKQIEEAFKEHLPPWVTDVKVIGQDGLMYHGHWIPQEEQINRRMAAHRALITSSPKRLKSIERDIQLAIAMAVRATEATTAAMDNYRHHVEMDLRAQIGADMADLAQTLARDSISGGPTGLIIGTGVEAIRAYRTYGDKEKYWDLSRLEGLNTDFRQAKGLSEKLVDIGFERESILRMEGTIKNAASKAPGSLKEEIEQVMRTTQQEETNEYVEMLVTDTVKALLGSLSDAELEHAAKSTNPKVLKVVEALTGGDFEARKGAFAKTLSRYGVAIDAAIIPIKRAAKEANTNIRLDAFRRYVGQWKRQVWAENEVIQTSREYWALRRAVAEAEIEVDRLMGLLGSDRKRNRMPDRPVMTELDNDSDFQIDITFSTEVNVSRVMVGSTPAVGKGSGNTWTGAFNTKDLSGKVHIEIDARSPTSGYRLDNPYTAPLWSTEKNEFNDYKAEVDDHHFVYVEASKGSGITVGAADMFGHEGLRVKPATGVKALVYDEDGEEIALSTITSGYLTDFIPLKPGTYTLRLDIGKFEPALPAHCTDGYVRKFVLEKDEQLQFNASVYTARIANNGQTVGQVQGECIKLKK